MKSFNNPSIITLQETKVNSHGTLRIPGYQIFEKLRKGNGGGLLTAINNNLNPVLIQSENDSLEILIVQCEIKKELKIRVINCYGPQETESKEKLVEFWQGVESEILSSENAGCHVLVQTDANAKLGPEIVKNDPHQMSSNGKYLRDILKRLNLSCLNSHRLCTGTITRFRKTKRCTESAVLDFIIVSRFLSEKLTSMLVDEKRQFVITKYASGKGIKVISRSDHNPLWAKFRITLDISRRKKERVEIFDFKNQDSLASYKALTNNCFELRSCCMSDSPPEVQYRKFFKTLDNVFHKCFRKIRVRTEGDTSTTRAKGNKKLDVLFNKKKEIEAKKCKSKSEKEIEILDLQIHRLELLISEILSEKNIKIVEEMATQVNTLDGRFCQNGLWKLKKKLFPKMKEPPAGKYDEFGNLITAPETLKQLYLKTYQNRLEHRKISERYEDLRKIKNELWDIRFELLKVKPASTWNLKDVENAAKSLKNNQSRDPNSMINELVKPSFAGTDLQRAILNMMNLILESFEVPEQLLYADITSIYKNKGSRMNLENDRGIFVLSVLRKILDRLLYFEKYPHLDRSMSCSNVGARKHRNVRNHLFILNGVINNVVRSSDHPIDIQIYDLVQAFDALWLQDCMNDVYDCLPHEERNKNLALVYELNRVNLVAVNTPVGQTERVNLPKIVQQGGGWGPMECSVSIDKIGRLCTKEKKHLYRYREMVDVLPLSMVDDLLAIAPCGIKSIALNAFINVHIEMKKLRFHTPNSDGKTKCHKIHVGERDEFCPNLEVHKTVMPEKDQEIYLGDVTSRDASNKSNISGRVAKGNGKIAEVLAILSKVSLGRHYFKMALVLRETIFLMSIMVNSEVWYMVSKQDLEELESLDRSLIKRILTVPFSTPTAALYLETGTMRIGTLMKARRLNYLHYLISISKEEMLSRFFYCQWYTGKSYDWTTQVKKDIEDFEMSKHKSLKNRWASDRVIDIVASLSKRRWKNIVQEQAEKFELRELLKMKDMNSPVKMKYLKYTRLKLQDYFSDYDLNKAKTLFRFRTFMSDYAENYHNKELNACPLCINHLDSQELGWTCTEVVSRTETGVNFEDVFQEYIASEAVEKVCLLERLRKDIPLQ